ncbi:MAG: hypothetical protein QOI82_3459, partial [Actinomycetota bacterium]|nr:hypothetical protein [Actinomycetota bacterium]
MLRDADGTGGHAEGRAGLLGTEAGDHAQEKKLAVCRWEPIEQCCGVSGLGRAHDGILGPDAVIGAVGELVGRVAAVSEAGTLGVGDLVTGDAVDEGRERPALVD